MQTIQPAQQMLGFPTFKLHFIVSAYRPKSDRYHIAAVSDNLQNCVCTIRARSVSSSDEQLASAWLDLSNSE